MPIMPCPLPPVNCPGFDGNPFINTSSEAPDQFDFLFEAWGPNFLPPLGWTWQSLSSYGTSPNSPDEALTLATNNTTSTWLSPTRQPHPTRLTFSNDPQTGETLCPDGNPYMYDVPAGMFKAGSKVAANEAALEYANQQAILHMICFSDLPATLCQGEDVNLDVFASSTFLAPPGNNTWEIVSGSLPTGLNLSTPGTGPAVLSGTPSATGDFNFVLGITLPNGDNSTKEFFISVAGITNGDSLPTATIGTPYTASLMSVGFLNPTYSVTGGSLPDGIKLGADGTFSGTPASDAQTSTFEVTATDEFSGFQCATEATITCITLTFKNLVWGSPTIDNEPAGGGFGGPATIDITANQNVAFSSISNPGTLWNATAVIVGTMNYTGPQVACNLHFDWEPTQPSGPSPTVQVQITQDGNGLIDQILRPSNPAGGYDFSFTVAATAGSVLQVSFGYNGSTGFAGPLIGNVTMTLTP